jgi:hypothetical protein
MKERDMKIQNNISLVTSNYMSKFERFWICNNQEKVIFLRGAKTFGSPCTLTCSA